MMVVDRGRSECFRAVARRIASLVAVGAVALGASGAVSAQRPGANGLRAGSARIDITPTDLTKLDPFGGGSFTAVHDPIFARVLVMSSGGEQAAIVTFDLPEVGDMAEFRRRIERETGIRYDHILLAATHDHSAPRLGDLSPGTRAQRPNEQSIRYSTGVFDKILAAIRAAKAAQRPAKMGVGRGSVDVNVSRDAYTPGKGWGMGYNPDAPSDKTVRVLRFDGADGQRIATLFFYGVHSVATFGIKEVSGDLAGAAERFVEENGGGQAMFVMGAGGDQVPRVQLPRGGGGPPSATAKALAYRAMEAQGLMLGAEVLRVARGIADLTGTVRLRSAASEFACPTKTTAAREIATISTDATSTVTIKLAVLTLNQVAIGGISGEVVTPIETRLLRETPLTDTFMATLVNDRIGYIADDAAYDTLTFEVGGSPAARGCAEKGIVDGLVGMIREQTK